MPSGWTKLPLQHFESKELRDTFRTIENRLNDLEGLISGAFDQSLGQNSPPTLSTVIVDASLDTFLRSMESDHYESGTLTFDSGTTVNFAAGATVNFNRVTGVSPFTVDSTTVVTNLNADNVDGIAGANFLRSDESDTGTGTYTLSNANPLDLTNTQAVIKFGDGSAIDTLILDGSAATTNTIVIRSPGASETLTINSQNANHVIFSTNPLTIRAITDSLTLQTTTSGDIIFDAAADVEFHTNIVQVNVSDTVVWNFDMATGTSPFTVDSTTVVTNLNADTVDGIGGGSFLRSDTSDNYTSGILDFDSGTTVRLADSVKILLGDSANDGEILYDGTDLVYNSGTSGVARHLFKTGKVTFGSGGVVFGAVASGAQTATFDTEATTTSTYRFLQPKSSTAGMDFIITNTAQKIQSAAPFEFNTTGGTFTITASSGNIILVPAASVEIGAATPLILGAKDPIISWGQDSGTPDVLHFHHLNSTTKTPTYQFEDQTGNAFLKFNVSSATTAFATSSGADLGFTTAGASDDITFSSGNDIMLEAVISGGLLIATIDSNIVITSTNGDITLDAGGGDLNLTSINTVTFDTVADKTVDFNASVTFDCGGDTSPGGVLITQSGALAGIDLKLEHTNALTATSLTFKLNSGPAGNTITFVDAGSISQAPLEFDSDQGYRFNSATGKTFHVNQDGLDCDSIFESENLTKAFEVDASEDRVMVEKRDILRYALAAGGM